MRGKSVQRHYTVLAGEGWVQGLQHYDLKYPSILPDQGPLVK